MKTTKKKIRFGVIGTNFITEWVLAGALLDSRFQLTAVYSRREETGKVFAEKYAIANVFTSLETMLSSNTIDAVYIASPNALHAQQAILCMEFGKHVLVEKAFASNVHQAQKMIETARKQKVVLMEAMKPTLTPNFRAVIDNIHRIGKVRRYFSAYCQYSSRYDKLKEGVVLNAFNPALSNGGVVDIGVYTIYPMVVLFGRPRSIKASGIVLSSGVDGQGSVTFEYDGMTADIIYSKIADSLLPTEIQGEEGTITLDRINVISDVKLKLRNGATFCNKDGEASSYELLTQSTSEQEYYYEICEFIDLIEAGKGTESAINSLENSLITMEILDEIRHQIGVVFPADAL